MNKLTSIIILCIAISLATISVNAAAPILGKLSYYSIDPNNNHATKYVDTVSPTIDVNGVYVYDLGTIKNEQKPVRLIISITDSDNDYNPTTWYNIISHCEMTHSSCIFQFRDVAIPKVSPMNKYHGWNPVICDSSHTKDKIGGCYDTIERQYDFLYPYPGLVTPVGKSDLSITFTDTKDNNATLFMKVDVEPDDRIQIWFRKLFNRIQTKMW
jgi:hypothetical protein